MAFRVTRMIAHGPLGGDVNEYICSEESDVAKLPRVYIAGTQEDDDENDADNAPCWYGSIALVCTGDSTSVYALTPDNQWTKM